MKLTLKTHETRPTRPSPFSNVDDDGCDRDDRALAANAPFSHAINQSAVARKRALSRALQHLADGRHVSIKATNERVDHSCDLNCFIRE